MKFEGDWEAAIGQPEMSGVWMIWGHSSNGKTNFALQLAKYLCQFGRVAYNSLEEGARESFKKAIDRHNMKKVNRKLIILDREPIDEMSERLLKRKSPRIVLVDSFQHAQLTYPQYTKLKTDHPEVLFIFISHADGRHPSGRTAKTVRYDADVKIWVEGFKAMASSRYGGGKPFVIWPEGAKDYWGE